MSAGGTAVQLELVRSGKLSVPTLPLGAAAPAQFVLFDQFAAPTPAGVAPLQVKLDSAVAEAGAAPPTLAGGYHAVAPALAALRVPAMSTQGDPEGHDTEYA